MRSGYESAPHRKDKMYIIVGLGNPGREYAETRHNAGFRAVDAFIDEFHIDGPQVKFRAMIGKGTVGGEKVLCVKPLTYMNLSGEAVRAVCDFYKIDPTKELIVICDDIAIPAGHLRIRKKGSAGSHNGLENIILHLGTQDFIRIRVGVGDKPEGWDLADHVLAKITGPEKTAIEEAERAAAKAAAAIITDGVDKAMNRYNTAKERRNV